jgi:hypothetical protein
MPPLCDVIRAPPIRRDAEVLNQQPPHTHRRHCHHGRRVLDAELLAPALPHRAARYVRLLLQVVTVDAVETASVESTLRDESVELIAEQNVGVGDEEPLAARAPETDVLGIELRIVDETKEEWGWEL